MLLLLKSTLVHPLPCSLLSTLICARSRSSTCYCSAVWEISKSRGREPVYGNSSARYHIPDQQHRTVVVLSYSLKILVHVVYVPTSKVTTKQRCSDSLRRTHASVQRRLSRRLPHYCHRHLPLPSSPLPMPSCQVRT